MFLLDCNLYLFLRKSGPGVPVFGHAPFTYVKHVGRTPRADYLRCGCGVDYPPRWVGISIIYAERSARTWVTLTLCVMIMRRYNLRRGRGSGTNPHNTATNTFTCIIHRLVQHLLVVFYFARRPGPNPTPTRPLFKPQRWRFLRPIQSVTDQPRPITQWLVGGDARVYMQSGVAHRASRGVMAFYAGNIERVLLAHSGHRNGYTCTMASLCCDHGKT